MAREGGALLFALSRRALSFIPVFAATDDPVGSLDHTFPIQPDEGRSKPFDYWENVLHKRKPAKRKPQSPPENPHDPNHQIDDFA